MSIPREKWLTAREDYIRGRGSLAVVAARHGLKRGSVEKRARNENWTGLRGEFEGAQLAKLIPPPSAGLPPAPVAPDGVVSSEWLTVRQELYYRENAALLDKARKLLDEKLTASEKPSTDELGKMVSALNVVVSAESQLLGLRDRSRRKEKPRRKDYVAPLTIPTPTPAESYGDSA